MGYVIHRADEPAATLSLVEAAALLGMSRRAAWTLVQSADFPAPRMVSPTRRVWLRSEVLAWLESRPTPAAKPEPAHLKARREAAGVSRERA